MTLILTTTIDLESHIQIEEQFKRRLKTER